MKGVLSRYALFCICSLVLGVRWSMPNRSVLTWDVFGYYLYLPATVIHNDLPLRDHAWLDAVMTAYEPSSTLYQLVEGPEGARVIKYSSGMAVLFAPFFFAAHSLAGPLGFPADGFSPPYQIAITIGALAFALFGLHLLRKVLLHLFDDRWAALLLVLIGLGTNWFQLTAWDGTLLTHSALFTLYAALLLATISWHKQPSFQQALVIGGMIGLITLVRPSELVCALIPLLWGLGNSEGRSRKWAAIKAHAPHLLLAGLAFVIAMLPQLIYWKTVTGHWLFYSYVNPGEGFDFATPHTWPFLFSSRKGWLVYTPLMLLALAGIPLLWKRKPDAAWAVLLFLLVDLWVVSSWSCWWYAGGSFSARSMVPAYVLLVIPLGIALQRMWRLGPLRYVLIMGTIGCLVLNLFQTWQWTQGVLKKDRVTRDYYRAIFGRTSVPKGAEALLLVERPFTSVEQFTNEADYKGHDLFFDEFNGRPDSVLALTAEAPFSPGPDATYDQLTLQDHAWLRTTARLWVSDPLQLPPTIVMTFHHEGATYKYAGGSWTIPPGTANTWITATMDYITPEVRSKQDNVKVYIWNQHNGYHLIDDLRVQVFEKK